MSCSINGKLLVDRTKVKPRNYTDQIVSSRELKSEVMYWLYYYQRHLETEEAEKEAFKNRRKEWFCPDGRHDDLNAYGGTNSLGDARGYNDKFSWN